MVATHALHGCCSVHCALGEIGLHTHGVLVTLHGERALDDLLTHQCLGALETLHGDDDALDDLHYQHVDGEVGGTHHDGEVLHAGS